MNFSDIVSSKQDEIYGLKGKIPLFSINEGYDILNIEQVPEKLNKYVQDEIIVKYKNGIESKKVYEINQQYGTSLIYKSNFSGFQLLKIPNNKTVLEMVELYNNDINVKYAEPNYIGYLCMSPNDPYYDYQWHLHDLDEGGINISPHPPCRNRSTGLPAWS